MLNLPSTVSIFLHARATDMRKGFDGLSGLVREAFGADPLDGSLYLFVNRRRDRLKILHFDGTGFWLYYKKLETEGTPILGFTEVGRESYNHRIGPAEAGRMVGISRKSGPRRCVMSEQGSLSVPPRAVRQRESFRSINSGRS